MYLCMPLCQLIMLFTKFFQVGQSGAEAVTERDTRKEHVHSPDILQMEAISCQIIASLEVTTQQYVQKRLHQ